MRPEFEQALALMKDGGDQSLNQAVSLLQSAVYSFSMHMCGHPEDAEDTMQDVLVQSIHYLPRIHHPRALAVWLYKVARTRCGMSRRKSKYAPEHELSLDALMPDGEEMRDWEENGPIDPEVLAMKKEQAQHLRAAIAKLPPDYRIVLVLREMEGLSDEEVAEVTGITRANVRVRLHRARAFVRKELMKLWRGYERKKKGYDLVAAEAPPARPADCKAMFAELSNYLDEELDDSLCRELESHLHDCEPCQAFIATLEAAIDHCRSAPAEAPDGERCAKLREDVLPGLKHALARVRRRV
jgi:RNA polymerase sigma-70 factor (ECF subfamily)